MGLRATAFEAVGPGQECGIEGAGPGFAQRLGMPVVDALRGHVADARVAMLVVVPGEEHAAMGTRILDAAETRGEVGPVL